MRLEDAIRLQHMIEAAEDVASFMAGRVRGDLGRDRQFTHALTRAIEIFGEAAAKTSPELRQKIPALAWTKAIAMRNRIAHAYFDIDYDVIWSTATKELPPLLPLLSAALAADPPKR